MLTDENNLTPGGLLIAERDAWRKKFEAGEKPVIYWLDEYRNCRNSRYWRATRAAEECAEYILFLEEKVQELEEKYQRLYHYNEHD